MPLAGSTRGPGREKSTFPASPNFSDETGLESAVAAESRPVGSPGGSLLACSSASARLWSEARSARRPLSIRSIALRMLSTLLNSSACRSSSSAILLERREETTDARTPRRWMAATSARKFSSPETNKCRRQGERSRMQRHRQPRRVSNHRTLYRCHFPCCAQSLPSRRIVDPIEERPSARHVFRVVYRANRNLRCSRNRKKPFEVDVKA